MNRSSEELDRIKQLAKEIIAEVSRPRNEISMVQIVVITGLIREICKKDENLTGFL